MYNSSQITWMYYIINLNQVFSREIESKSVYIFNIFYVVHCNIIYIFIILNLKHFKIAYG